jgi:dCMP deaminase
VGVSYFDDVLAMNQKFDFPRTGDGVGGPRLLPPDLRELALKFLREEVQEFEDACRAGDLAEAADALVDVVVVALGRAAMMRLDFDAHWAEVVRANGQKVRVADASESKRGHAFDLRKPSGWRPPDHSTIIDESRHSASAVQQASCCSNPHHWVSTRRRKWDQRLVKLAREVASWSKDPSTKVGCVIRGDNPRHVAVGYNGFPRGIEDTPERLSDRGTKNLLMQHAERSALDNATFDTAGATLVTTFFPCCDCAKSIVSKEIKSVVVASTGLPEHEPWSSQAKQSREILIEAGVAIRFVQA